LDLYPHPTGFHPKLAFGDHSGKIFCVRYQKFDDVPKVTIKYLQNLLLTLFRFSVQSGAFYMVLLPSFRHAIGTDSGKFMSHMYAVLQFHTIRQILKRSHNDKEH
jgi:hypothetical protein